MGDPIRILHVDDDPKFRDMTAKFLQQESDRFELVGENRGSNAEERLNDTEETIDCVVSDYALPDMNGVELLKSIRDEYPDLPFILFTGKGSEVVARDALRAGATDYLQKQSGTQQYDLLANRIRNATGQARTEQRVAELERVRTLVRDINQALVRASSVTDIETTVCELISESEPYLTACIAAVDTETMQVEPRTWAGADQAYFQQLEMSVSEDDPGYDAPGGRAYHSREIAVSQDILTDPRYEQWRDAALERGFESLAVVPLEYEGQLHGLLAMFASRTHAFDATEREILTELADDIAHALNAQSVRSDLQQTASRLKALFEESPDMINVHDSDGTIVDPNPRLCERTGYSEDELTGMKVWELDQEIEPEEAAALWDGMEIGDRRRLEGVYQCRDGSTFPVEVHVRRLEVDGQDRFVASSRDITEKKQQQKERERSERYRRKLYEITSADLNERAKLQRLLELGCERLDVENGNITRIDQEVNRHEIELAGGSDFVQPGTVTELTSAYCREIVSSEDILAIYNAPEQGWEDDPAYKEWGIGCYIGGRIEVEDEFYGTLCFVDREPRRTEFSQSERTFVDLMSRWVSHIFERRQHEQQLREHQTVVNTVPDGIYILDDDFRFRMVNDALAELTGYSRDELRGADASLVFEEEAIKAGRQNRERLLREQKEYEQLDTEVLTADGETIPCVIRGRLLPDSDCDGSIETVGVIRDVTEKREHERRLQKIISRVTDAIVEVDSNWTFTLVNDQAEELYGMGEDELLGREFWDVFPEARDTRFEDEYRSVMETREPTSLVEYYPGLDGWFDIDVYPTDDGGLAFYFREITERRKRQRRFEAIFNNTFQYTGLLNPDGTLIEANETALSFGGVDRDDVVGKRIWNTYWFQSNEQARETARAAVEQARTGEMFRDEIRIRGADREAIIDFSVRPITDEQGEVTLLIPEGRDITERREREEELAESEARYRALAENFPNGGVFLFDDQLEYQIVSGAGFEPIETSADDLVGNTIYEVEPYSEEVIETLEPLMEATLDGNRESTEITYEDRVYKLRSVPIRNDEEVIAGLYISQDVTERRQRERELKRQNERLEEFASVVSHDLRSPLNVVEGRLELARADCDSEHLAAAETGVERAQTLIDDLLTLAREGEPVNDTTEVDVDETVRQCWQTVETSDATLETDTNLVIRADYGRSRQLFENLIRNAIDHGRSDVTISVGELADGFYVEDNGPGIPEDERSEVFETGYSTSRDGTGFGLSIVKRIAEGHGWEIHVTESTEGGARFEITGVNEV